MIAVTACNAERPGLDLWYQVPQILTRYVRCGVSEVIQNLQYVSPRPVAIVIQILLALRCVELNKLLLLKLVRGEMGEKLKKVSLGNGLNVKIVSDYMPDRARLWYDG